MADLPETGIAVMNALIGAPLAWQAPAQLATALGRDLEETLDLLCDLDVSGWVDVWEDQDGPLITLSPLAAERLCVRIVEVGPSETPRWAGSGDPDPPALRSRSVCKTDRGAGLDYVIDPTSSVDFLSHEDPDESAATTAREQSRAGSRLFHESWPTILIGMGLTPWPGPTVPLKSLCPACAGRILRTCMYCLYCDRWGRDRPAAAVQRDKTPARPPIHREGRDPNKRAEDEQAQIERLRERRKSKRRRKRARAEQDRLQAGKFSSPKSRGEAGHPPKPFDLGLAGPPRAASAKGNPALVSANARPSDDATGIVGRSPR